MSKNIIPKCRPARDFVQVVKDNPDGSRTVQISQCLEPIIVIDKKVQP